MRDFPEAVDRLRAIERVFDAGNPTLSDDDARALAELAVWSGPPSETVALWGGALRLCSTPFPGRPPAALRDLVVGIAHELTDGRMAGPDGATRANALVILESLVLAALVVEEPAVAARSLRRWSSVINEAFLEADLGPGFLGARPETGDLNRAAHLAYARAELGLAVESAEAGRLKLLAAVASGAVHQEPPGVSDVDRHGRLPAVHAERLRSLIEQPSAAAARQYVTTDAHGLGLSEALLALATPWHRLMSFQPEAKPVGRADRRPIDDEVWSNALREPRITWLVETLAPGQLLIYPYLTPAHLGAVLVGRGEVASVRTEGSGRPPTPTEARVFGAHLPDACASALEPPAGDRHWPDARVVDWDPGRTVATQAVAVGYGLWSFKAAASPRARVPAVIPSARVLRSQRTSPAPAVPPVTFVGDPTQDLPGPWIEARAWRSRMGENAELHLGPAATRERVLKGLRRSQLVIVSGHTFGTVGHESFGIGLHDGDLTHHDLLAQGDIAARQVILSCCSAAASIRDKAAYEVLGLVTTLLALGVRQVLAPLAPVGDAACAILGVMVADAIAAGADVRKAFGHAVQEVWSAESSDQVFAVSHDLPDELSSVCPHDRSLLAARSSVTRAEAYNTLVQFSLFGGGPVGPTPH